MSIAGPRPGYSSSGDEGVELSSAVFVAAGWAAKLDDDVLADDVREAPRCAKYVRKIADRSSGVRAAATRRRISSISRGSGREHGVYRMEVADAPSELADR